MSELTRRELLRRLSAGYTTALLGCQKRDWFKQELVCIHIFNPKGSLPSPLLKNPARLPRRSTTLDYFQIGLPELILCTTRTTFLDMFQYFWPFSRDDFETLRREIKIDFQKQTIKAAADIEEFARFLREHKATLRSAGARLAVVLTFHEFTSFWTSAVVAACRDAGVEELIVFKDPSQAPYLCDYPSKQQGFKRPPS
ncbi:MAG: hypothetical protein HY237_02495 [Acidobacteria bacterium]|nr:hypothetical protein [Acidobacteriota bacterium]